MPQAAQPSAGRAAAGAGAVAVAGAGVASAAAAGAAATTSANAQAAAATLAASIMAAFVSFLAAVREQHHAWLARRVAVAGGVRDDIASVLADEMRREDEFARNAADRVASALPLALAVTEPTNRAAAIRALFATEERYAAQRAEAMAARAIAAIARLSVRRESPLGAYWRLGHAHKHTEGCLRMEGRFWPWAVLDRVHPPRHYGCTSTLHPYSEAVRAGWMTAGDVPDVAAAIRMASGVVMEAQDADALLRELAGGAVSEAFAEGEHPRGYHGRFRKVGDVAEAITSHMLAWRDASGAPPDKDAPSREQIVKNWTRQTRGMLSSDEEGHRLVRAAAAENDRNPLYRRIVSRHVEDHIVVSKVPAAEKRHRSMLDTESAAHRVAGTTVVTDEAAKIVHGDANKHPGVAGRRAEASSGYGLAALLRHEYGHSIDDNLIMPETRKALKAALPDPGADLSYYAGWRDNEVVPELFALVTDPRYDPSVWPESVRQAGTILLKALGETKGVRDGAGEAAS